MLLGIYSCVLKKRFSDSQWRKNDSGGRVDCDIEYS